MRGRELLGVAVALAALCVAPAPAGAAGAPSVQTMIVGKSVTLQRPVTVRAAGAIVTIGGRRCTVGGGTPLAALLAAPRRGVRIRDYGHCSLRDSRDSSSLFVYEIAGERNRGRDGWVYKVGRRAGTSGAADMSGPFGNRRLRAFEHVLWFWCHMGASGCQRSLDVSPAKHVVSPGESLRVTVRGYDDAGRGRTIGGATVTLGSVQATTDAHGTASLTAPTTAGSYFVSAARSGLVPSFFDKVSVR
jgi:hypothetical protein